MPHTRTSPTEGRTAEPATTIFARIPTEEVTSVTNRSLLGRTLHSHTRLDGVVFYTVNVCGAILASAAMFWTGTTGMGAMRLNQNPTSRSVYAICSSWPFCALRCQSIDVSVCRIRAWYCIAQWILGLHAFMPTVLVTHHDLHIRLFRVPLLTVGKILITNYGKPKIVKPCTELI
jgi:hypothetical protein